MSRFRARGAASLVLRRSSPAYRPAPCRDAHANRAMPLTCERELVAQRTYLLLHTLIAFPSRPRITASTPTCLSVFSKSIPKASRACGASASRSWIWRSASFQRCPPFRPLGRCAVGLATVTKATRSAYDHYMLLLHDAMKADADYQRSVRQVEMPFPIGHATWGVLLRTKVSRTRLLARSVQCSSRTLECTRSRPCSTGAVPATRAGEDRRPTARAYPADISL
jgi:hypothetical protein